jgi:deferrochelatase/peroxidase EfeB
MKKDRSTRFAGVEFADVQGLVSYSYHCLKEASYFVLQIVDPTAARAWLAKQEFTPVVAGNKPDTAVQVAFTYPGLAELGVPREILCGFPTDFRSGMAGDSARSRRLGDFGPNDPKCWHWGGPGKPPPHLLVMLFAKAPGLQGLKATIQDADWKRGFEELVCLSTSDMHDYEPFGFKDGISQPKVDWGRQMPVRVRNTYTYAKKSALGEFLLGYPNEYARYTDRPLLRREDDPDDILLPAEDVPDKKDFGRNGTYLVLRDLEQDVAGFWKYADAQALRDPNARRELAQAMVGRTLCGDPIVLTDARATERICPNDKNERICPGDKKKDAQNQFTFRDDPGGTKCPLGAHIRRANPRTADLPEGTKGCLSFLWRMLGFGGKGAHYDLLESVRFHRLIRRGREYGPQVTIEDAIKEQTPPQGGRGLRFVCINANILRQFEFVQNSWIANPKFEGLDEADPLLGNREPLFDKSPTNTFTRPQPSGICRRHEGLPVFVTVRGGAYFFMPGLRALRYICSHARSSAPAAAAPGQAGGRPVTPVARGLP